MQTKRIHKGRIWTTIKTESGFKGTIMPYTIEIPVDVFEELGIARFD